MKPQSILKLVQSQVKRFNKSSDDAQEYYERQQDAIMGIMNTSWMQEIKDYFYRLYDSSVISLSQVDPKDSSKVAIHLAEMRVARNFLDFLDNVTG